MFPPHSLESPKPVAASSFLPASCCMLSFTSTLSSCCHEPAGVSVYARATVRSGFASQFSEKQTIFVFFLMKAACIPQPPLRRTLLFQPVSF